MRPNNEVNTRATVLYFFIGVVAASRESQRSQVYHVRPLILDLAAATPKKEKYIILDSITKPSDFRTFWLLIRHIPSHFENLPPFLDSMKNHRVSAEPIFLSLFFYKCSTWKIHLQNILVGFKIIRVSQAYWHICVNLWTKIPICRGVSYNRTLSDKTDIFLWRLSTLAEIWVWIVELYTVPS